MFFNNFKILLKILILNILLKILTLLLTLRYLCTTEKVEAILKTMEGPCHHDVHEKQMHDLQEVVKKQKLSTKIKATYTTNSKGI